MHFSTPPNLALFAFDMMENVIGDAPPLPFDRLLKYVQKRCNDFSDWIGEIQQGRTAPRVYLQTLNILQWRLAGNLATASCRGQVASQSNSILAPNNRVLIRYTAEARSRPTYTVPSSLRWQCLTRSYAMYTGFESRLTTGCPRSSHSSRDANHSPHRGRRARAALGEGC